MIVQIPEELITDMYGESVRTLQQKNLCFVCSGELNSKECVCVKCLQILGEDNVREAISS